MTHDPVAQTAPHKVVIMARGLGTRMRKSVEGVSLTADQAAAASAGVKAMISLDDRPFLDYVISALADAGFDEFCLVIGPEHNVIRDYYDSCEKSRLSIVYAVQEHPLGTADAVAAAEELLERRAGVLALRRAPLLRRPDRGAARGRRPQPEPEEHPGANGAVGPRIAGRYLT